MSSNSIWPVNEILSVAITPGQSGSESNGKESLLHIPQTSRTETKPET